MILRNLIFSILFLGPLQFLTAQDSRIRAFTDKQKILIGEPLLLTVEAHFLPGSGMRMPLSDTIPHFEFLELPVIDTPSLENGLTIRAIYKLTSFDSGHWVIPSFSLSRRIKSDTLPVDVVFSDFDPKQAYHDIKDIVEVTVPEERNEWWYMVAGGVLILALILFLLFRKKSKPGIAPERLVDPYEEAKSQLALLENEKPEAKQYYTRLTGIFRQYVYARKGVHSLQKTTDDLVIQLKSIYPDKENFEKLAQSLRLADFVKFARFVPGAEDNRSSMMAITKAIEEIEKKPDAL